MDVFIRTWCWKGLVSAGVLKICTAYKYLQWISTEKGLKRSVEDKCGCWVPVWLTEANRWQKDAALKSLAGCVSNQHHGTESGSARNNIQCTCISLQVYVSYCLLRKNKSCPSWKKQQNRLSTCESVAPTGAEKPTDGFGRGCELPTYGTHFTLSRDSVWKITSYR